MLAGVDKSAAKFLFGMSMMASSDELASKAKQPAMCLSFYDFVEVRSRAMWFC